jgi:steroid 5-alpha reductase family enzyme
MLIVFYPFIASLVWYGIAHIVKRSDVVDVAWGANASILTLLAYLIARPAFDNPQTIILLLVFLWGIRLSYHITKRLLSKQEDPRYAKYRKEWGSAFPLKSYIFFFLGQSLLIAIIAIAPYFIAFSEISLVWTFFHVFGLLVWIVGFLFESISDKQLKDFLKDPKNKGKLMTQGLWKYSRHPNYFGEATMWWGIFLMLIPFPWGWLALISPLTITFFLLKVTGVPLAEQSLAKHPDFEEYKRKTSIFIPLPPKK